jgi:sugar phosphate isomerase/epimerase
MTPADPGLLSLNTATVRVQWALPQIVDGCARHGIHFLSPWRDQVAAAGLKESAQRLRDAGLALSGSCRGGMFTALDRAGRLAARDANRRAVDEALTLGAPCLVLVVGGLPAEPDGRNRSKDRLGAREMVRDGIGELSITHGRVECRWRSNRCIRCTRRIAPASTRWRMPMRCATSSVQGWASPSMSPRVVGSESQGGDRARRRRDPSRLLAYHICDWLVPTTDLLQDRGMMGDGVIDLPLIRSWMTEAGYRGPHEVEIFSANNWWKRDPDEVLSICKARHAEVT